MFEGGSEGVLKLHSTENETLIEFPPNDG
ncbi:hypothetical protein BCEP4_650036 [Burkholderia cepacia]|nr:hypothetical protein BCEP4_650036 [Burkholderia cepacia]